MDCGFGLSFCMGLKALLITWEKLIYINSLCSQSGLANDIIITVNLGLKQRNLVKGDLDPKREFTIIFPLPINNKQNISQHRICLLSRSPSLKDLRVFYFKGLILWSP